MEIKHNPWEWTAEIKEGSYKLVRADEKTRQEQLKKYKEERIAELKKQIEEVKLLG